MYYTWRIGDVIYVVRSDKTDSDEIKLIYVKTNNLKSNINPNIYFNETLFPKYFIGQVLYLDDNKRHIMYPYEIVKIKRT